MKADLREKGLEIKEWMDSVNNIRSIEHVKKYLYELVHVQPKNGSSAGKDKDTDDDKSIEQYYKEREKEKEEQLEDLFSLLGDDKTLSNNIMAINRYSSLLDYSTNSVLNGEIISERIWEHNYNRLNATLDRKGNYVKNIILEDELKRFTRNLDFADIQQVEEKAVHTMAERIKSNPIIKSFVYGLYLDHGNLNTEPTDEGKKHMDINHPLINVKRIENKPISDILLEEGVRWRQVLEAKDKGLITFDFGFKKANFIYEQLLNLYREISGEIDHWDRIRAMIIDKACKFMVVEVEQLVVKKLDIVAEKYMCRKVCEHVINNYTRKTRLLKSNVEDDLVDLDSFRTSEWDKRICVLMRVSGEEDHLYGAMMTSGNIEHLFIFKHLLYYQKVKSEDELAEIKQDDWTLFKTLMDKYEPNSIVVDSMNITVQDKWEIENALALLVNKPKIEPLMGEVALSSVVCNRFVESITRNWGMLVDQRHWGNDTLSYCGDLAKVVSLGFYFFHTNEITKYFLGRMVDKIAGMERYKSFIDNYVSNSFNCTFTKCVPRKRLIRCLEDCAKLISKTEGVFINYRLKFAKESTFYMLNKIFNRKSYYTIENIRIKNNKTENINQLYPIEHVLKLLGKLFHSEYNNPAFNGDGLDDGEEAAYKDLFSAIKDSGARVSMRSLNEANDIVQNNNLFMNKLPYLCPQNSIVADLFIVPFCKYETLFAILFVFLEHSTKLISDYLKDTENLEANTSARKSKRTTKKKTKGNIEDMSDFEKIIHELLRGNFTFLNNYMLKRKLVLFNKVSSFCNNYKDILQDLSASSSDNKLKRIIEINSNLFNEVTEVERNDLLVIFQDSIKRFLMFGITYAIKGEPSTKQLLSTNPQNEREFENYKLNFVNTTLYGSLPGPSEIFESRLRTFGIKVGKLVSARVTSVVSGELECVVSRQFIGTINTSNFRDKKLDVRGEEDNKESALKIEAFFLEYASRDGIIQTRVLGIDMKNNRLVLSSKHSDLEESVSNTNNFYACIRNSQTNTPGSILNHHNTFKNYNIGNINQYNINVNVNYTDTNTNKLQNYSEENTKPNYNDKEFRIINEKCLNLGHDADKIDNIEKEKLIKTSKENLIRASQNRQCDLFYFKNYSSDQQIREEMDNRQDGSYLVHPHPEHFNRLVVCIKLNTDPILILNLHILEEGKTKETILEIGKSLRILGIKNSKIYQSIEDLVYNYILGISEKLLIVRQHKRFRYGIEEDVETNMKEEYKRNKAAAYCLSFSYKKPGVILLCYVIDGNLNVEAIVAEPDGYVFRRQKFSKIDEVVNKFKIDPYRKDSNI